MTITLKPWMTVLLIATFCVLAGFAVGQVTSTQAAKDASASSRPLIVKDGAVLQRLDRLNKAVDSLRQTQSKIKDYGWVSAVNSLQICRATAAFPEDCEG